MGDTTQCRLLQHSILDFIRDYTMDHDMPPTIQEVADHVGRPKTTAYYHLVVLKSMELVSWEPMKARTLEVL